MTVHTKDKTPYYQNEINYFLRSFIERKSDPTRNPEVTRALRHTEMDDIRLALDEIYKEQLEKLKEEKPRAGDEKTYGFLHPIVIAEKLTERLKFKEEDNEQAFDILRKCFPRDRNTGLYERQAAPYIIGLAHQYALEHPEEKICLVRGDFTNMGQSNKAIGEENTDKLLRYMSGLLERSPQGKKVEVHGVRIGGDEVGLVVFGRSAKQMQEILDATLHPSINLISAQIGVHDLLHRKKGKFAGFGASFTSVDMNAGKIDIDKTVTDGIEASKIADGALRFGLTTDARVEEYLNTIYRPYIKEHTSDVLRQQHLVNSKRPEIHKLKEETVARWKQLTGEFGRYEGFALPQDDPRDFFNEQKRKFSKERDSRLATIIIPEREGPLSRIPGWAKAVPHEDIESPAMSRMRKALAMTGFMEIAEKGEFKRSKDRRKDFLESIPEGADRGRPRYLRFVMDLMNIYDDRDPVSRCRSNTHKLDDAAALLIKQRGKGLKVVHLELTNLNGLNTVSEDLANAVLRELGGYIEDAFIKHNGGLGEHAADYVYHEGNGKFKVLLPADFPQAEIGEALKDIRTQVQDNIQSKSITGFALKTYAKVTADRSNDESEHIIEALQRRIKGLKGAARGPLRDQMSDIRHPVRDKESIRVNWHESQIGPEVYIDQGLIEKRLLAITEEAERKFQSRQIYQSH